LVLALAVLVAVGIRVLGSYFVYLWMGSVDFAEPDLIAAACAQSLGLGVFSWLVVLLSALSQQRLVLGMAALTAVVFLPLSLLCGQWFGPVGVAAAQAGTLLFVTTPLGCFLLYHLLAKTRPRIRLGHTI
jgi:O-antigen/teichoic acid export membrane protein